MRQPPTPKDLVKAAVVAAAEGKAIDLSEHESPHANSGSSFEKNDHYNGQQNDENLSSRADYNVNSDASPEQIYTARTDSPYDDDIGEDVRVEANNRSEQLNSIESDHGMMGVDM